MSKTHYKEYVTQTLRDKGSHAGIKELFLQTQNMSQTSLLSAHSDSQQNSPRDQSFVSLKRQSVSKLPLNGKRSQQSFSDKELTMSNFPLDRYMMSTGPQKQSS